MAGSTEELGGITVIKCRVGGGGGRCKVEGKRSSDMTYNRDGGV